MYGIDFRFIANLIMIALLGSGNGGGGLSLHVGGRSGEATATSVTVVNCNISDNVGKSYTVSILLNAIMRIVHRRTC